jgi:ATP-dependent Lhr-like helicase
MAEAEQLANPLAPADGWFATRGWTPFPFQREVWQAYLRGESGLLHATTGAGKTYAAWLGPLLEYIAENTHSPQHHNRQSPIVNRQSPIVNRQSSIANRQSSIVNRQSSIVNRQSSPPSLRVLWLTPLRALAADTAAALQAPLDELGLPWTLETRTSDTSSSVRARQQRRLPTALVTTPESLSLLLTRPDHPALFAELRAVVVDEWHELLGTKRGVQTELCLARLRRLRPALRTWGLSATLGNLEEALATLVGESYVTTNNIAPTQREQASAIPSSESSVTNAPAARLVRGLVPKAVQIDALIPHEIERFPWAGHLGLKLLPQVVDAIEAARSTLVFTNTRAQTETWYGAILDTRPEWAGEIALHHGSLDRDTREWVEQALRDGRLRCVVCTSSLDLGVDFAPVERVIQIGSPKGVARLLQRAGRSGHRPGVASRVSVAPTSVLELLEVAAVRDAAEQGRIEARPPLERPLDLLAQHMVTLAVGGGFRAAEVLAEVRTTRAFRHLSQAEWDWALDFVVRGGPALYAYPEYARVVERDGLYQVVSPTVARRHRMAVGTIVGDAALRVQFVRGAQIGSVEESFAARLKPGDRFQLAGRILEFVRVRDMTVWVRRAGDGRGVVPRWSGGRMPLSGELAAAIRAKLDQARQGSFNGPEMRALRPILAVQERWSHIPAANELLIERARTREGYHLFVYPFEGRLVHEGLAALLAYRISRIRPLTFTFAMNDYGFELLSTENWSEEGWSGEAWSGAAPPERGEAWSGAVPPKKHFWNVLFETAGLEQDILFSLNATEMTRRQFREIARVAGLIFEGFPGEKSLRQVQASSGLLFDVFAQYDPDNLLMVQARREVLARQLEQSRLVAALERIAAARIIMVDVPRITPLAFPLLVDRLRERLSSETLADRVRKMQLQLEKAAG